MNHRIFKEDVKEGELWVSYSLISSFKSIQGPSVFFLLIRENELRASKEKEYTGTFDITYKQLISYFPNVLTEKDIDKSFKKAVKLGLMSMTHNLENGSFSITLNPKEIRKFF